MKSIVVIHHPSQLSEAQAVFAKCAPDSVRFVEVSDKKPWPEKLGSSVIDCLVDLRLWNDESDFIAAYEGIPASAWPQLVLVNSVYLSIRGAYATKSLASKNILGVNALPSLLNRPVMEMSNPFGLAGPIIDDWQAITQWDITWVEDRVGMAVPRVLAMIINEAFYTLQEKTASAADIDISMKLGTNYPFGPFQWADRIGIAQVYHLLNRLFEDTHDDRYKVAALLKDRRHESLIS